MESSRIARIHLDPSFRDGLEEVARVHPWLRSRTARIEFLLDLGIRAFRTSSVCEESGDAVRPTASTTERTE